MKAQMTRLFARMLVVMAFALALFETGLVGVAYEYDPPVEVASAAHVAAPVAGTASTLPSNPRIDNHGVGLRSVDSPWWSTFGGL